MKTVSLVSVALAVSAGVTVAGDWSFIEQFEPDGKKK
jgi:hypothetical protein